MFDLDVVILSLESERIIVVMLILVEEMENNLCHLSFLSAELISFQLTSSSILHLQKMPFMDPFIQLSCFLCHAWFTFN